jgi:hypothetical protein
VPAIDAREPEVTAGVADRGVWATVEGAQRCPSVKPWPKPAAGLA